MSSRREELTRTAARLFADRGYHGTSLADTLYDDFGTAIDRSGAIALAYTQSCARHSPSDRQCPGASQSTQANTLVVRSAWIAGPHKSRHPRPSRQGERDRP